MPDFAIEELIRKEGYSCPAGVDEAGRGPLAGPVVIAAVVLPEEWPAPERLDDSKKLAPAAREEAYAAIRRLARAWSLTVVSHMEIDRLNILRATMSGMIRAVQKLKPPADYVLVDGNRMPELSVPGEPVVKGDGLSLSIAAASILAKVVRDRIMCAYGRRFPQWGFEQHKGYGTRKHLEALARYGPSPIHRSSFKVRHPP